MAEKRAARKWNRKITIFFPRSFFPRSFWFSWSLLVYRIWTERLPEKGEGFFEIIFAHN